MRYILKIMLAIVLIILIGCASYILLSEDKISENKGDNIYISEKIEDECTEEYEQMKNATAVSATEEKVSANAQLILKKY